MSEKNRPTCGGPAQLLKNGLLPHVITFHIFFRCFFSGGCCFRNVIWALLIRLAREKSHKPPGHVCVCVFAHTYKTYQMYCRALKPKTKKDCEQNKPPPAEMNLSGWIHSTRHQPREWFKIITLSWLTEVCLGEGNPKRVTSKKYGKMNYENDSRCGSSFAI